MKYAIKVPFEDDGLYVTEPDQDGNPVVVTYDTFEEAELVNSNVWDGNGEVVEYDVERLRAKKKLIHDELYDQVKKTFGSKQ